MLLYYVIWMVHHTVCVFLLFQWLVAIVHYILTLSLPTISRFSSNLCHLSVWYQWKYYGFDFLGDLPVCKVQEFWSSNLLHAVVCTCTAAANVCLPLRCHRDQFKWQLLLGRGKRMQKGLLVGKFYKARFSKSLPKFCVFLIDFHSYVKTIRLTTNKKSRIHIAASPSLISD